jgi:hypothetical protein
MDITRYKINVEFVNMVFRTLSNEMSIQDVLTQNPDAAAAHTLHLSKVIEANEHFLAMIVMSPLFQATVMNALVAVNKVSNPDDKRKVLNLHFAQMLMVGIHFHEQLLDKAKKGLINS